MFPTSILGVAITIFCCYWAVVVGYGVQMVLKKTNRKHKKYQAHRTY